VRRIGCPERGAMPAGEQQALHGGISLLLNRDAELEHEAFGSPNGTTPRGARDGMAASSREHHARKEWCPG